MDKSTQDRLILLFPVALMIIAGLLYWLVGPVALGWFMAALILAPLAYVAVVIAWYETDQARAARRAGSPAADSATPQPPARPAPHDPHGLLCPHCGKPALSLLRKWTLWSEAQQTPCRACGEPVRVASWHRMRAAGLSMLIVFAYLFITPLTDRGSHAGAILGLAFALFILLESFTVPLSPARWQIQARRSSAPPNDTHDPQP